MARIKKIENPISIIITLLVIGLFIFPMLIVLIANLSDRSASTTSVADGFTINAYNIILDVGEDNIVDVTEEITVNWYEAGHHGIYKFVPTWLEYTGANGKTIKRKSNIYNFRAVGEQYSVSNVGKDKERIKIGSPSKTVPIGLYTYTIKYTYDMGEDPFENFDEFIFHAYGDFWGTRINNATIQINLPTTFNANNIKFYADKYREKDITSYVDYFIEGNTIYATISNNYKLNTSLTVDIELPEGYFVGCSNNYGTTSLTISIIVIIGTVITLILWIKFGKDNEKEPQTVEFYPPENLDAAQVGYIYGKQTGKKLTIALIVQLASKGYIRIEESEDKTYQTIYNLNITKQQLDKLKNEKLRTIKIAKAKEIDDTLNHKEKIWMKYLFKNGNSKDVMAAFDEFYKKSNSLIERGYITVISDKEENANEAILNEYEEKKLPTLTETEEIVYNQLFRLVPEKTDISLDTNFYLTFDKVSKCLEKNLKKEINDSVSSKIKILAWIWSIIAVILSLISYFAIPDLSPRLSILYSNSFICAGISIFLAIIMGRKTPYGERLTAQVLGFRDFLEKVEKPQLEQMVEKNPNYFYDILPYTYVLNVSKKWIEKFENITIPQNYMGNFEYYDMNSFDRISDSVRYPSSSGSSSGGCSSCGGGCSSCGGGCSSCGGGGSW